MIDAEWQGGVKMTTFSGSKKSSFFILTDGTVGVTLLAVTTPGSFGERVQSHSERSGSCFFLWGSP